MSKADLPKPETCPFLEPNPKQNKIDFSCTCHVTNNEVGTRVSHCTGLNTWDHPNFVQCPYYARAYYGITSGTLSRVQSNDSAIKPLEEPTRKLDDQQPS